MERFIIYGQPPSKSNAYKIITIAGHASLAKTKATKDYEQSFYMQCPLRNKKINRRFKLQLDVYFSSDRPDLDNALKAVLDCLQACNAISNDRLCSEIVARKLIDKTEPRIVCLLEQEI